MTELLEFFEDLFEQVLLVYGTNNISLGYLIAGALLIIMAINFFRKIKS